MKENILKQFEENGILYNSLGSKLKDILLELMNDNNIGIHYINFRLKDKSSLERKIDSKGEKYKELEEITDLCGLRIITYLESDVDKVADIVENEFNVDRLNSIDKRLLKTDQFGYRSLHYVVCLNDSRITLSENKKYKGLKAEIQIRSILQHAWAEIEHDLGYKGEITIPENLRRSFNRLAALLETADIEFDRLKKDIGEYEKNIANVIQRNPEQVKLDQASVRSFVRTNKIFNQARELIKKNTGCKFMDNRDLTGELERFELFKIDTIAQLNDLVTENKNHYLTFVDLFSFSIGRYEELDVSLPLFYFQHYLASSTESTEFLTEYFNYGSKKMGGGFSLEKFIEIYQQSKAS